MKVNRINRSIFLLVFTCAFLSGCMPEPLEVRNIPPPKLEMVVSTQILSDSTVVILLTKTVGALDASSDSDPFVLMDEIGVDDAVVTIEMKGVSYLLLPAFTGVYTTTEIPIAAGELCKLTVRSASLGELTAYTTIQAPVPFDTVAANVWYNGFADFFAEVKYQLTDPSAENFYLINVQSAKRSDRVNQLINPDAYTRLVEDAAFNGLPFRETFVTIPKQFNSGDSVAVSVSNIHQEYYDFLRLRVVNRFGFAEYFSEPINYPTNIIGGRGYFNLHIADTRIMVL